MTNKEKYELYVDECEDSGDRGHIVSYEEWLKTEGNLHE